MVMKNHFIYYAMLFFIVIILFPDSEVMAFNDEPCYGLNYEYCNAPPMTVRNLDWSITLQEPFLRSDGLYEWEYTFVGPSEGYTGANFSALLIPDCCNTNDLIEISDTIPTNLATKKYDVAEGEETIYFGRYNEQAYVYKFTPDSTGTITFIVNTAQKTRSTFIIKSGKDVYTFEMAAPGCPLAPPPTPVFQSGSIIEEIKRINDVTCLSIKRNVDLCAAQVSYDLDFLCRNWTATYPGAVSPDPDDDGTTLCDSWSDTGSTSECDVDGNWVISEPSDTNPDGVVSIFSGENQLCPEGFRQTSFSPDCIEYVSGGKTYYFWKSATCPP